MATNFHSELPNDQIHPPKDFSEAHNSSVVTKDLNGALDWARANYTLAATIVCGADAAGSLNDKSFKLCSDATTKYALHYVVAGYTSLFTSPYGYTAVPINIAASAPAGDVATATQLAINALAGITAVVALPNSVNITGMVSSDPVEDVTTSFIITNTETPVGSEFLQTNALGEIKWGSAPGGGGCSNSWGAINTPAGSFPTANGCADTLVLATQHGRNIEIEGNNGSDTVYYTPHTSVHFRGNVESGLEGNTKYCFRQDNNKDQKFQTALGVGGVLNAAQAINAGKMIPNAGAILKSVTGYISAPNALVCHLYLYRYAFTCGESQDEITPTLVAQTPLAGISTTGNNTPFCFDLNITTTTYGDYDILVPAFSFGAEPGSSARTMWKITMY